jgi:hypothetical protein
VALAMLHNATLALIDLSAAHRAERPEGEVGFGLGRIGALHHCSSTSHHMH